MSDFGSIIYIKKTDATSFSDQEYNDIVAACHRVAAENPRQSSLGSPYLYQVGKTRQLDDPQCYTVNVLLSDYHGDRDDFEWNRDVDLKDALEISRELQEQLPAAYALIASFEWW